MCKEAKILLVISSLFTFAIGLSSIFVNIFFWNQTNNFMVIAIYNLMHYIAIPITFITGGIIAKKKNGIWSLRLGLTIYALFYVLILFVGNKGVLHIYILGIIYGAAVGFYWLAFNTLSFDFTHINNRDTFNGFNGSCAGIASAISPIISAYIISKLDGVKGYKAVFAITLCMFVALTFISMFLKCKNYGSKLDFKKIVSGNSCGWNNIRGAMLFWGFRDVIIVFLINILIIETTGSVLSLGELSLIASLISSVSYILVQRIIKPPRRRLSIFLGSAGSFLAVLGLVLNVEFRTLLIYITADAFFLPFFLIQLNSSTFNIIDSMHEGDLRVEYVINKEIALNAGRIISSIVLLILLWQFKNQSILKIYLLIIGFGPVISGYLLGKLKKVLGG